MATGRRQLLVKECSEKLGKANWLQATAAELETCLATGTVPDYWQNGASTSSSAILGGGPAKATEPMEVSPDDAERAIGALAAVLSGRIGPAPASVDESRVKELVGEALEAALSDRTMRLEVKVEGRSESVSVDKPHMALADLIDTIACGCPVFLVGPTGSGKTHGAEQAAMALGLDFYPYSVGPQTSKSDLLGFFHAGGAYIPSLLRRAYEFGGLFLLDEADSGNGAVLTILNAATSNGYCSFPDGVVKMHPNFRMVAAGNTWGRGADRLYVGRCQLDEATLRRFCFINWDYDEALERDLASFPEWAARVQAYRHAAEAMNVRIAISPRATLMGCKLLSKGFTLDKVESMVVWCGLDRSSRDTITHRAHNDEPRAFAWNGPSKAVAA